MGRDNCFTFISGFQIHKIWVGINHRFISAQVVQKTHSTRGQSVEQNSAKSTADGSRGHTVTSNAFKDLGLCGLCARGARILGLFGCMEALLLLGAFLWPSV